jgi:biopolymer transport protein ExbB
VLAAISAGEVLRVWLDGGWCMVPLAGVAIFMYLIAVGLLQYFSRRDFRRIPAEVWSRWIEDPRQGQGEVGEIIRYTQDEVKSLEDIRSRFNEIHTAKIPRINRRLDFLHKLITAAPLLGLLGTVLGMIKTFAGIARGGGSIVEMISSGIAEALITTETGLLIALPGYFMAYIIRAKRNQYEAFLARLESATMQHFQKNGITS